MGRKHTGDLASNGGPNLSLGILQELNKGGHHIAGDNLFVHGLGDLSSPSQYYSMNAGAWRVSANLLISISNHIPDPPALVLKQVSQRSEQHAVARLLLLGNFLGNRDENINCQKTDTVLVVIGEVLEEGYHFIDNHVGLHLLDELGEVVGRLPADHGGLIVYKVSEVLAEALLKCLIGFPVWCRVQTCGRDL